MKKGIDQIMTDRENRLNRELVRSMTPHCEECGGKTDLVGTIMKHPAVGPTTLDLPDVEWSTQCTRCKSPGTITNEKVKYIEESLYERGKMFERLSPQLLHMYDL